MALFQLHQGLIDLAGKDRSLNSENVCDRFAELILDPRSLSVRISEDVSNLLRGCLADNDPINRVYDTVDAVLSLERDAEGAEAEMEAEFARYCDQESADDLERVRLLRSGEALRSCIRTLLYMKRYGMVEDFRTFFEETEDEFEKSGTVAHPSKYVFVAKVLFVNLLRCGQKEELCEKLFVSSSAYRLRAAD